MKEYEFFNAAKVNGSELKEGLDRKNRRPLGETKNDEDEETVNQGNPKHRYQTDENIADESYLTFGELEEKPEEPESTPAEFSVEELNPENLGRIGAAHILPDQETIVINREVAESNLEDEPETEKWEEKEEKDEDYVIGSRLGKYQKADASLVERHTEKKQAISRDYESNDSDNLKTMPERKKQRNFRERIRSILNKAL